MSGFSLRKYLIASVALLTTAVLIGVAGSASAAAPSATTTLDLIPLGTFTGTGGLQSSEIVAFDSVSKQMYVNNGALNRIDIVDIANPATPALVRSVDMSTYGRGVQSVAVGDGIVAAAVDVAPVVSSAGVQTASAGVVVLMDTAGQIQRTITVGTLPDHVSFTPDKKTILVAGEGEPMCSLNDSSTVANEALDSSLASDAKGTVSLIDVSGGATTATVTTLDFLSFTKEALLAEGVRVFFPGSSAAQDLEPEYITTNATGTRAYVTLQEANAIAVIDLATKTVVDVASLGYKDWGASGLLIDTSDRDNGALTGASLNLQSYNGVPLKGMYMPDTIASMQRNGETFLLTANEGDDREYTCFAEKIRAADSTLNTNWSTGTVDVGLKTNAKLSRLNTTNAFPTKAALDAIYTYGGRSFSIWNSSGQIVWDSGSQFEEIIARDYPAAFNSDSSDAAATPALMVAGQAARIDGRSDDKGPEPEALAVGTVGAQTFAFIGLERMGGIMVYDVSTPSAPTFIRYKNAALEGLAASNNTTPGSFDVSPEGMVFVPASVSPNAKPMLIVANELSGTTTMYEVRVASPVAAATGAPSAATIGNLSDKTITATVSGLSAGGTVSATYGGFVPFETVQLVVASTPTVIGTGTADSKGVVTISGTLPVGLASGAHTLSLFAPVSGIGAKATITLAAVTTTTALAATTVVTVTTTSVAKASRAASESLPATGQDSSGLPLALGFVGVGSLLLALRRLRLS